MKVLALAFAVLLTPAGALAQDGNSDVGFRGLGPRVGMTIDPDQFHFGGHVDFGNFARRVRFQPSVEIGISDDVTVTALNFEGTYRFNERWDVWVPYLGGGPSLNIVNFDDGPGDDSDTDVGLNIVGGVERGLSDGDRFFTELKLGLADAPDLKMTVGWTFYND